MSERAPIEEYLNRLSHGDHAARRELSALVYDDLRTRAEAYVRKVPPGAISATTLVHEAYLRLIDGAVLEKKGTEQFLALASKVMRDLLVDFARRHGAKKRGGDAQRITLSTGGPAEESSDVDVLDVHDALLELAKVDPHLVEIVEMRYFGGLTLEEISLQTKVPERTLSRELVMAQAWLRSRLGDRPRDGA